jgi:hypothetical protein
MVRANSGVPEYSSPVCGTNSIVPLSPEVPLDPEVPANPTPRVTLVLLGSVLALPLDKKLTPYS